MGRGRAAALTRLAGAGLILLSAGAAQAAQTLADQWAEYEAVKPKTILQLQPFRQTTEATTASGTPMRLISVNPNVNAWFVLELGAADAPDLKAYHIENPDPRHQTVALVPPATPGAAPTLALDGPQGPMTCAPWDGAAPDLTAAAASGQPYAKLCDGRLLLRNEVKGAESTMEGVTDFLRSNIWGGDAIVNFVKNNFYQDAFAEKAKATAGGAVAVPDAGPTPAPTNPALGAHPEISNRSDLTLTGTDGEKLALGQWYPVTGLDGVFASAITPGALSPEILNGPGKTNPLDQTEAQATDYLVAFDLGRFEVGYALGTDHPRLDWSPRPPDSMQNPALPGPDGIDNPAPLVRTGAVSPADAGRTIATFTGGFKREHGAFHRGPLSEVNAGSHYGFIENGAIFSKLWPGLSTLYVLADGTIGMKTWTEADNAMLPQIRFARQNGVPLVETDPATGQPVPGQYVTQWSAGNWSGSAEAQLRTLRGGACMIETPTTRYLVYGYFSTVTPSGMARVFQGYGCKYAMILDMNALEHTYLALYVRQGGQMKVEHMVPGMALADRKVNGERMPRFLAVPDNRDFFYLMRKDPAP